MLSLDNYTKPPLLVHILFHPESAVAREIAQQIHVALNDDPVVQGLRIPTVFCRENESHLPPDNHDLDEAGQSFVLVLADSEMNASEPWCEFVADQWELCKKTPHRCVPVQLTDDAWPLSKERLGKVNFLRAFLSSKNKRPTFIIRHVIIELCRYLNRDSTGDEKAQAPTTLFISHTKMDIEREPKAVNALKDYLLIDQPVKAWFDSGDIPGGSVFSEQIAHGIQDASLLCVLTDNYTSREWCRREILLAKKEQRPAVVVDALNHTEVRSFPYLGNLPVIRWNDNPEAVIAMVLKETLRHLHTVRLLQQICKSDDEVFTRPPELSTIIGLKPEKTVLYPDPPLGTEETEMLKQTGVTITTPIERLTHTKTLAGKRVALSMSESTDCHRYGVDKLHLDAAMLEVSRYLLIQGMTLVYGGHLGSKGYTDQLIEMVRAHNNLDGVDPVNRIINYVGWPVPVTTSLRSKYKYEATLEPVTRPADINEQMDMDFKLEPDYFSAETSVLHRYAWSRGMTAMRESETKNTQARIVLGGTFGPTLKIDAQGKQIEKWYSGRIPGVLEEIMLSIAAGQPVFLLGGFGGTAAMVVDILEGKERAEMSWDYQKNAPHSEELKTLYKQRGDTWQDYDQIISTLRGKGIIGINTLLSEEEHRILFHTRDPILMAGLIIKGLAKL